MGTDGCQIPGIGIVSCGIHCRTAEVRKQHRHRCTALGKPLEGVVPLFQLKQSEKGALFHTVPPLQHLAAGIKHLVRVKLPHILEGLPVKPQLVQGIGIHGLEPGQRHQPGILHLVK